MFPEVRIMLSRRPRSSAMRWILVVRPRSARQGRTMLIHASDPGIDQDDSIKPAQSIATGLDRTQYALPGPILRPPIKAVENRLPVGLFKENPPGISTRYPRRHPMR